MLSSLKRIAHPMAVMALVCSALPSAAHAQATPANANGQHVQGLLNMYRMVDYALGANESCDIFTIGHYRALLILRQTFRSDLGKVVAAEKLDESRPFEAAKQAWRGCLKRAQNPQEWTIIDNVTLLGNALIAAPNKVSVEPKECAVEWGPALSKYEWPHAATSAVKKYQDTPRQAEFEKLRADFAAMIDGQCQKRKISELMQPGYEQLRHTEDNYLYLQRNNAGKKQVFTSVGSSIANDPVSRDFGVWRSRRGGFSQFGNARGITAYRVLEQGDVDVAFFNLARSGTFSAGGKMTIARKGRMTARMKADFDALELRLANGRAYPLTKTKGEGGGSFGGSSEFTLPADAQKALASLGDDATFTLAYRIGGDGWQQFLDIGKDAPVQQIRLGDIRSSLDWSNAPMIAPEDR